MSKNIKKEISPERAAILRKIEQYEREGRFDEDVENDPESPELRPEDIKYLDRSLWAEIKNKTAFASAYAFLWMAQLKKNIILKDTVGVENLAAVKDGAIITCNHFNPLDSFVMQRVFDRSKHKGRMYRIIREGNYTGFPGFYGFLMRNCDTLPLSSNSTAWLSAAFFFSDTTLTPMVFLVVLGSSWAVEIIAALPSVV